MNKKTFLIKNYALTSCMLYLDYSIEEEAGYRYYPGKTIVCKSKAKNINSFKKNGESI